MAVCGKKCPLADTSGGGVGKQSCGAEFLVDEGCNLLVNDVDGAVAFNHDDAGGIAGGDLAVFVVNAAVKELVLALEAGFVALGAGGAVVAATSAVEGLVEIREQQEGEVGIEAAAHGPVHAEDDFAAELAATALIGLTGVREAIAENNVAAVERGRDDFGDALGASGEHESELGHGIEALGFRVEEQGADAVADAGASRLAGDGDGETLSFEVRGEFAELRRFAGAVQAFEGEEEAHKGRLQGTGCRVQGGLAIQAGALRAGFRDGDFENGCQWSYNAYIRDTREVMRAKRSVVVSMRLPVESGTRLKRLARRHGWTASDLSARLVEEGLRRSEFALIDFRDSPVGRQAYIQGSSLAVWEVMMIVRAYKGNAKKAAGHLEWPEFRVLAAVHYTEAYPKEINEALAENDAMDFDALKKLIPDLQEFRVTKEMLRKPK